MGAEALSEGRGQEGAAVEAVRAAKVEGTAWSEATLADGSSYFFTADGAAPPGPCARRSCLTRIRRSACVVRALHASRLSGRARARAGETTWDVPPEVAAARARREPPPAPASSAGRPDVPPRPAPGALPPAPGWPGGPPGPHGFPPGMMPPPWPHGAPGLPFLPQPGAFPGMFPPGAFPGGFPAPLPFMPPPHPGAFRGMPPPPAAPSPSVMHAEFLERERERGRRAAAAAEAAAAAAAAREREERGREEEQQRRRERDAAEAREIAEAREREAAKGAFKQLLLERGVVPGAAWDAELAKFCHDPRCKRLQDPADRKARAAPAPLAPAQSGYPCLCGL